MDRRARSHFAFVIALGAATVYYLASRKLTFLVERAILAGLIYGALVYLFMHIVVLPLSAVPKGHMPLICRILEFVEHWFFVGLPIALSVRSLFALNSRRPCVAILAEPRMHDRYESLSHARWTLRVVFLLWSPKFGMRFALPWCAKGNGMLKISVIDSRTERRLLLESKLITPWVAELRAAWKAANEELESRALAVDLRNRLPHQDRPKCHNLVKRVKRQNCPLLRGCCVGPIVAS